MMLPSTKTGYRPQPKICEKLPATIILAKPFLVLIYKAVEKFYFFFDRVSGIRH
jgi:hypothetical protein